MARSFILINFRLSYGLCLHPVLVHFFPLYVATGRQITSQYLYDCLPGQVPSEMSHFNVQVLKNKYVDRQNDKRALLLKSLIQILVSGNICTEMNE
jgi:hypothetical protein